MIDVLLVVLVVLALLLLVQQQRTLTLQRKVENQVEEALIENQRREQDLKDLGRKIDRLWDGLDKRIGEIHDTFATGQACRLGDVVYKLSESMPNFDKKLDLLISRSPTSATRSSEAKSSKPRSSKTQSPKE